MEGKKEDLEELGGIFPAFLIHLQFHGNGAVLFSLCSLTDSHGSPDQQFHTNLGLSLCWAGKEQGWLQGKVWEERGDVRVCLMEGEKGLEPFVVPEVCQEIFPNDFTPLLHHGVCREGHQERWITTGIQRGLQPIFFCNPICTGRMCHWKCQGYFWIPWDRGEMWKTLEFQQLS